MKNLFLIAIAIIGLATFTMAQVPDYVPTNGLVGLWPFNGNTNDISGNNNNGINNGATLTTDRFGISNNAYSFNGTSNYINVPNSTSLQFNGELTISAWVNASSLPSPVSYWFSKGADGWTPYSWVSSVAHPGDLATVSIFNDNNQTTSATSLTPVELNKWIHLVFTFDGSYAKCYFNGKLESSVASSYTTFSNIYDLKFGKRFTSGLPYFWNGKLDDFGIWNRALTDTEITNLYNGNICFSYITVTDTLTINANITGFNPVKYTNTIKVYPNPTKDAVTIDCGNNYSSLNGYTIKITNSLSQTVYTSKVNQQSTTINLNSWTGKGIYFVHLIDASSNTIDIKKIVLQ